MDTPNLSAPLCAQQLNPRGVTHINVPHTTRFTVVGNHLAQHRQLSLTAIGLALHIQSLPDEARVDIKTLADRFTEGETRIAAALRELKAHGYLAQVRKRLPNGRVVTHTVSYNRPQGRRLESSPPPTAPEGPPPPAPDAVPPPPPAVPEPRPTTPAPPSPSPASKPPLLEPQDRDPELQRAATALLVTLHHDDPRFLLAERDVQRLAPAVATWLERGARPEAVRHSLTSNLPRDPVRHPAALLAHRLTEFLPAPAPPAPPPGSDPVPVAPMVNCDGCDRGFRTWEKNGRCRDCREAGRGARDAET
ncbi:DNA-binding protein [Streptomyces sp. LUP47B]|uniref:DNA-binding protein n=1 Tax=Streptomyces sp. LUP47B TaxID=1890286 RepID=UPI00085180AB|nr:DNA-binding protein [Streptomyces sp. LUP47B]